MSSGDHNQPLDLDEAQRAIAAQITPINEVEQIPCGQALGRIAAREVLAPLPLPPFRSSAMDGYAVAVPVDSPLSGKQFELVGTSAAGHPFAGEIVDGQAIRVLTGAAVPNSAERVVLQEDCSVSDGMLNVWGSPDPRSNIREPGDDLAKGAPLVARGERLDAFALGHLAAAGVSQVQVVRRPRVGVFASGDELLDPDQAPLPYGKIFESNRTMVLQLLKHLPLEVVNLGTLPDDPKAIEAALDQASVFDALITSGGVSVGDADHIRGAIEQKGELKFWRLNLKPGKPLAFGQVRGAWFFGLPGNPVSTAITLLLIAKPALMHLANAPVAPPLRMLARLTTDVSHSSGRAEYQRGLLTSNAAGELAVAVTGAQGSNRISSLRGANCLIEIGKELGHLEAGAMVPVFLLSELLR